MMSDDFLKEYLTKISEDISKVFEMVEKDRERDHRFLAFMEESKNDRRALRELIEGVQVKVDKLAELFGVHKKKGMFALLIATVTGAAIASGSLNYQKIIEKLIPFGSH